jgi:hypothetical protein
MGENFLNLATLSRCKTTYPGMKLPAWVQATHPGMKLPARVQKLVWDSELSFSKEEATNFETSSDFSCPRWQVAFQFGIRVTGWVWEKIAKNAARFVFVKINAEHFSVEGRCPTICANSVKLKKNFPKRSNAQSAKIRPIWSPCSEF